MRSLGRSREIYSSLSHLVNRLLLLFDFFDDIAILVSLGLRRLQFANEFMWERHGVVELLAAPFEAVVKGCVGWARRSHGAVDAHV